VAEVTDLAGIYVKLLGARIRGDLQYRVSFALFTASQFLVCFLDFLAILIIFSHTPRLGGWSLNEVLFLYGATNVSFNLSDVFVSQVETLPMHVRTGSLDRMLTRPLGALFQLVTEEFALRRIGKLLQGVLVLGIALARLDIAWTPAKLALAIAMIVSGAVIFSAVWVTAAAINIWTVETTGLANAFTYGGNFLTQYPLDVYSVWMRRFFAYIVPMAFVNYFPSLYILGKAQHFGIPALRFASPLIALAFALAASAFWRVAVRHYRSTGS
jgi:ABC-2 type transport system permease protein